MKLISIDVERLPSGFDRTCALARAGETGRLRALVRLHGQPLGLLDLAASRTYSAAELGRLIAAQFPGPILEHLVQDGLATGNVSSITEAIAALPERCPQKTTDAEWPSVTVAVCTRNGAGRLGECVSALEALEYPADRLEILVVDNAPADDATKTVVAAHRRIRYVPEPRPGLDWARNRAVLEARGDIVAFTDDDVSVDSGWVQTIAAAFRDEPDAMCVTGLVVPDELDTHAQVLFENYGGFGRGFARIYATDGGSGQVASLHGGTGKFGTGANMAFRRSVFTKVGLFDPALDVGTVTNGGGDLEMFFRVLKGGHLLLYEPGAIVRHRHRREYAALRRQLTDHGVGFYSYLVRSALAYPEERIAFVRLGVWWFWYWHVRRLIASLCRRDRFPPDLILAELRGSLSGLRRYFSARRHAGAIAKQHGPQQPLAGVSG